MKPETRRLIAIMIILLGVPMPAHAHFTAEMGDFYGGVLHPITDSLIIWPILGLGFWMSQQELRQAGKMIFLYTIFVPLGAVVGFWGSRLVQGPVIQLSLAILIGLLVFRTYKPAPRVGIILAVLFGVLLGYLNVFDVKALIKKPLLYTLGLCLGNGLPVLYITGFLMSRKGSWKNLATRIAGSLVVGLGVLFFMIRMAI